MTHVMKIQSAIACDDIRFETGNKLIAIGMYGQDITVPGFPCILMLRFIIVADIFIVGSLEFDFRVSGFNKTILMTSKGIMEVTKAGSGIIFPTAPCPFSISEPGEFTLQHQIAPNKWRNVQTWVVNQGAPVA